MRNRRRVGRGGRAVVVYGLLVAALAVWAAAAPLSSDPFDTSNALPHLALGLVALPSVLPLILSGAGASLDGGTFLVLVVVLAWAEAAAVHWGLTRLRARRLRT
ncbi:hypothetical protein OG871_04805 [Kitasatospora sp. NBC_00374]|uniref:hypothetical protein n=1 Tax=Kitasatospora sp. NBC_00374 TaxID=2975964 RepID=UPI003249082E